MGTDAIRRQFLDYGRYHGNITSNDWQIYSSFLAQIPYWRPLATNFLGNTANRELREIT